MLQVLDAGQSGLVPFVVTELSSDRYRFQWVTGLTLLGAVGGMSIINWSRARFGLKQTYITGLVLFTRVPVGGEYFADVLAPVLLVGIGAGLSFPTLMTLAMSGATPADSGLASGLLNTTAQVGGALGLAVLATLAASRTSSLLAGGDGAAPALTGGYHLVFGIGAGLIAVAIVLAATVLRAEAGAHGEAAEATEPSADAA